MTVITRTATLDDLAVILELEENWPEETRASAEKITARIEKFAQGFFLAEVDNVVVGDICCCPYHYRWGELGSMQSWNAVTNSGYYHDCENLNDFNSLYIVSGTVSKSYFGHGLLDNGLKYVEALARELGYEYVLAGAMIPGYSRYCDRHGEISAADYCFKTRDGILLDPLLAQYQRLGFSVPDRNHVVPGYFPDAKSRDFAAVVVKDLRREPPPAT